MLKRVLLLVLLLLSLSFGSATNNCTQSISSLNQASLNVPAGTVLCVHGGTYQPGLLSLQTVGPITLQAYPGETVIWKGTNGSTAASILVVQNSNWTIQGITFDANQTSNSPAIVINSTVSGTRIVSNILHGGDYNGLAIRGPNTVVQDNSIYGFYSGVPGSDAHCVIVYSTANSFSLIHNTIHDCGGDGIQAYYPNTTTAPIQMTGSILDNTFYAGTIPYQENAIDTKQGSWDIENNDISGYGFVDIPGTVNNGNPAIFIHKFSHDVIIRNNKIHDSTKGVHIFGNSGADSGVSPNRITLQDNQFTNVSGYLVQNDGGLNVVVVTSTPTPTKTFTPTQTQTSTPTKTSTPIATPTPQLSGCWDLRQSTPLSIPCPTAS